MKSISELRTTLSFHPQEINSSIMHFATKVVIDYDVYLPSKQMYLQRDFVWTIHQKREIIWSILMNRHIPRMAMVNVVSEKNDLDGVYQVIDGKQRLSSMLGFYKNEFTLSIDGREFFYDALPIDYRRVIANYMFPYYIVNEDYGKKITDQQKIDWFKYINFAGTPQDEIHIKMLSSE